MRENSKFEIRNSKLRIRKGDLVQVLVGKDRGRQGRVERVWPRERAVLVPGINQYKKHRKSQGENRPGEIVTLDRPIAVAKVALVCPKCKQPTRIGFRVQGLEKYRICRKCEMVIDEVKSQNSKVKTTTQKLKVKK